MRLSLSALLLLCLAASAEEQRPLRFSVTESWAMPMIKIVDGQATGGILYVLQMCLVQKVGRRAEMLVLRVCAFNAGWSAAESTCAATSIQTGASNPIISTSGACLGSAPG